MPRPLTHATPTFLGFSHSPDNTRSALQSPRPSRALLGLGMLWPLLLPISRILAHLPRPLSHATPTFGATPTFLGFSHSPFSTRSALQLSRLSRALLGLGMLWLLLLPICHILAYLSCLLSHVTLIFCATPHFRTFAPQLCWCITISRTF